ncbi:EcsC family protein [Evansella tamaricis]|uniref:EcsC family protein n=1 Tax=Evansella tamaricis TaxID=2069301 RepID=A0ABS6JLV2_9BACI|nr:EcsC family protein [Evansella tamaricis]MBU9714649.1 EcsC family protein [Evansella tamaricis]
MSLSQRETQVWNEIEFWESVQFSNKGTDFSLSYQKGINSIFKREGVNWSKKLLNRLDNVLFQLQATAQQGRMDQQTRDNIFSQARIFQSDIYSLEDMKKLTIDQLRFIAKKQLARQRIIAFTQGGLTGFGGLPLFLSDLPLMLTINLRTVQLVAMTYGYDLRKPYEMMMVLKVFHAISLPRALQEQAWKQLISEVKINDNEWIFYEGEEEITEEAWMQRPLNHLIKIVFLSFARRKLIQGVPLFSVIAGASINYEFARHISEASHFFYQKRHLIEKHQLDLDLPLE